MATEPYRRIMVYGTTGSGKTTLAARIGAAAGLPYHAIDNLTFEPGWVQVPPEKQREVIAAVVAGDAWVIDAGYSQWLDVVLRRVDLIVGLDYPPPLIFFRLLRRTLLRLVDGKPICNGNRETLRMMLSRESILLWFFKSYKRKRSRMRGWAANPPCQVLRFARPADAAAWLRSFDATSAGTQAYEDQVQAIDQSPGS
ncbi:MAG: AAA family ATPase [Fimbriimonadaceae bacterium]